MPRFFQETEILTLARTIDDLRREVHELRNSVSPVDTLWTFEDLAKYLKLKPGTVKRNYDKEWRVPYELIGGSVRFIPAIVKDHFLRHNLIAGPHLKKRYERLVNNQL